MTWLYKVLAAVLLFSFAFIPSVILKPFWADYVKFMGGDKSVYTHGQVIWHTLVMFFLNMIYLVLYRSEIPFFENYRISTKPWPWKRGEKEKKEFMALVWSGVRVQVLNLLISWVAAFIAYPMATKNGYTADPGQIPGPLITFLQLAFFTVVEDTLFYFAHRTFHHPSIYRHIHKQHHAFNHTVSIAAEYAHPIEFIFGNIIPFGTGPILLGAHCTTMYTWLLFRMGESVSSHSGYDFPWTPWSIIPFGADAMKHDVHHSIGATGGTAGNYATFYVWWDRLLGTDIPHRVDVVQKESGNAHRLKRAEAVKREVREVVRNQRSW